MTQTFNLERVDPNQPNEFFYTEDETHNWATVYQPSGLNGCKAIWKGHVSFVRQVVSAAVERHAALRASVQQTAALAGFWFLSSPVCRPGSVLIQSVKGLTPCVVLLQLVEVEQS